MLLKKPQCSMNVEERTDTNDAQEYTLKEIIFKDEWTSNTLDMVHWEGF